jgi:hypothetical protein
MKLYQYIKSLYKYKKTNRSNPIFIIWFNIKFFTPDLLCPRWRRFNNFKKDIGTRPEESKLIRIDPNKPYSRTNCKWHMNKIAFTNMRKFKASIDKF